MYKPFPKIPKKKKLKNPRNTTIQHNEPRKKRERGKKKNSPTAQQPLPPPKIQQHLHCQIHTHKPK